MVSLPREYVQTIMDVSGEAGRDWLQNLPALLEACAQRWGLKVLPPFELSYNYVAPAVRQDGTQVVLKVSFPGNAELLTEIAALQHYAGQGCVQLLEVDPEWGVLLLEKLHPGRMLVEIEDDILATSIAGRIVRQLWKPVPQSHLFPTVAKWSRGLQRLRAEFAGNSGPFPGRLVDRAERLYAELLASQEEPVLLHGDLHHYNILSATRQPWLALDPKGVVGEPTYEIGPWLFNPVTRIASWSNLERILRRRVDQFSDELGLDRQRILGWGLAHAVLSAWWSYEDHGEVGELALAVAEKLAELGA